MDPVTDITTAKPCAYLHKWDLLYHEKEHWDLLPVYSLQGSRAMGLDEQHLSRLVIFSIMTQNSQICDIFT